jgi:guanidinoacetate N-methyltransferase
VGAVIKPEDAVNECIHYKTMLEIGFPEKRDQWSKEEAQYRDGKLQIAGHPVMEDWEDDYMKALAEVATRRGGRVLELGFGMGISAGHVQDNALDEHVIIEANEQVFEKLQQFAAAHPSVTPMLGFWQDVIPTLEPGSFDGILFDTYPVQAEEVAAHWFFFETAYRLLKPGGVFTYFSDEVSGFSERHLAALRAAGFSDIRAEICHVNPPEGCLYWTAPTIVVPILTKG